MTELEGLLDQTVATARMNAAGIDATAAPLYVRHKPGETTIIAYRFDLADGSSTHGYAHWCHDPARADQILAKAKTLRPRPSLIGNGLDCIDDHTVLYCFPNDARLRRLRWYCDTRKMRRSLASLVDPDDLISRTDTTTEVLRYKPERRVVSHVSLRSNAGAHRELLIRYTAKPHASELSQVARHLRANGISTPKPLAALEDGRVSVDEFIQGQQLRETIAAGEANPEAVADSVARFHAVGLPASVMARTRSEELARAVAGLLGLARWRPELAQAASSTAELLRRTQPTACVKPSLLHGDLHTKNVLQTNQGLSFVDLERVSAGDPAIDLGYFLAHGIARPIRNPGESPAAATFAHRVVDHYRQRSNATSEAALAWHTAVGLIDQALLVARHLDANWQTTTPHLLEVASATLSQNRITTRTLQP